VPKLTQNYITFQHLSNHDKKDESKSSEISDGKSKLNNFELCESVCFARRICIPLLSLDSYNS